MLHFDEVNEEVKGSKGTIMDIQDFLKFLHKEGILSLNKKGGYVFTYHWKPEKIYTEEEARELIKGFHSLNLEEQEEYRFDNYDCSLFEAMIINAAISEGNSPETSDYLEGLIHKYLESRNVSPDSLIHTATPDFYEDVIDAFWLNVWVDYNVTELFEKNGLSQYYFIQQFLQENYEERKNVLDELFGDALGTASSYIEDMNKLGSRLNNLNFKNGIIKDVFLIMCENISEPHVPFLIYDFLNNGWGELEFGVNVKNLPLFVTNLDGNLPKAFGELEWKVMFFDDVDEKAFLYRLQVFFSKEGIVDGIQLIETPLEHK